MYIFSFKNTWTISIKLQDGMENLISNAEFKDAYLVDKLKTKIYSFLLFWKYETFELPWIAEFYMKYNENL